jgi:hypothetical protein
MTYLPAFSLMQLRPSQTYATGATCCVIDAQHPAVKPVLVEAAD